MPRNAGAKIDPNLKKQLDAAKGTDQPVEAVLSLRPEKPSKTTKKSPTGARARADLALERVAKEVGTKPEAVNVLENLDMVVLRADEPFLRKLLEQPEFASAVANDDESDSAS